MKAKKESFNFPHPFVLLFTIIVIAGLMTYIIPAGQFDMVEQNGRSVVDPGSFHFIEQTPVSVFDFFTSIPKGLHDAAYLIIMILLIGGAIRVFDSSGAIRRAILTLRDIIGDEKSSLVLASIFTFFGCLGAFPGMLEAAIPFAPLCIHIALTLGYDPLVGISIALVSIAIGWTAGPSNPWTAGIGHKLAELPMFSGFGYRLVIFTVLMAIGLWYVLRYARKIKEDPSQSIVADMDTSHLIEGEADENINFTTRDKLVLFTFATTIFMIVYGALKLKFGIPQMSATYIIGAIIGGLIAGYSGNKIAEEILEGGKQIFIGVMAIGLARAINVVMTEGHIADTIVFWISNLLEGLPSSLTAIGMFLAQTVINIFVPSGSGQAMVTLPILLPVSDIVELNRQITILAYQFGDGLSNLCYPTVGSLIAFLLYSKVPFNKWFKYIFPLVLMLWGAAIVFLIIAIQIGFGPF